MRVQGKGREGGVNTYIYRKKNIDATMKKKGGRKDINISVKLVCLRVKVTHKPRPSYAFLPNRYDPSVTIITVLVINYQVVIYRPLSLCVLLSVIAQLSSSVVNAAVDCYPRYCYSSFCIRVTLLKRGGVTGSSRWNH